MADRHRGGVGGVEDPVGRPAAFAAGRRKALREAPWMAWAARMAYFAPETRKLVWIMSRDEATLRSAKKMSNV